jgi:hypothetical protein
MITMGIMPGSGDIITDHTNPALLGMNCIIDVTSGEVSFPGATGASPTATTTESPLASIIEGDDVLFYVQFQKKGLYIDLGTIASDGLEIALKEFEPEATIIIGNTHIKSGTGEDATYILYAKAESVALAASLSNYEDDVSTNFTAVAQIRWKAPNATGIGPNPLVKTSQLFPLEIVRNVAP